MPPGGEVRSSLTLSLALIGTSGALVAGVEMALFADQRVAPWWLLASFPAGGLVHLAAGLVAWRRRPGNRTGPIMVIGGLSWFAAALANTAAPALVAVGVVLATTPLAVAVWLLHAFPSGRLRSRTSRLTVVGAFVVSLVLEAPRYLFDPGASPDGVLAVGHRADLLQAGTWLQSGAGMLVMLVTAGVLVDRLRTAEPGHRGVLLPLYGYGTLAVLATPLGPLLGPAAGLSVAQVVGLQIVLLAGVPIAFAAAMLRGGFARTADVQELSAWLASSAATPALLADALGRTLGDASLQVVYASRDGRALLDGDGAAVDTSALGEHRALVDIELGSRRIGAIVYDATVVDDAESVRRVGQLAALAIDHDRLTAELRASHADLQRSRARLVDAGDRARQRIAQDLHDGLQVELVLLALEAQQLARVEQAAHLPDAATHLRLGIDGAARELRGIVHALMPAALVERGLTAAIEDLVDRMPLPTRLAVAEVDGRLPATVERTAYFVVAEALTNAVKHAAADTLTVTLEHVPRRLVIGVIDDGVGGATQQAGAGLHGLADRVDALGGRFSIHSPAGGGTHLRVELPCGS
ncbi:MULTISPECIES: sensor histidine kinase [unclassified Modestobacter]|uniref:sensor histidine kinase n=1 Tax=unclassified Modestobacter TaxID=2643866 RepID=UPI0022AA38DB|nr:MULTISPECIES: ATP-binding protein [unclassified Modestobacter]MCZ2826176.1 histidine kinase [Modestobacter sp. VKM Ac-2981]MCZ2852759.1 histidine kinase [Modestobacter sp. VKM Ac-2982]